MQDMRWKLESGYFNVKKIAKIIKRVGYKDLVSSFKFKILFKVCFQDFILLPKVQLISPESGADFVNLFVQDGNIFSMFFEVESAHWSNLCVNMSSTTKISIPQT